MKPIQDKPSLGCTVMLIVGIALCGLVLGMMFAIVLTK